MSHRFLTYWTCRYSVTLTPWLEVTQGHRKWHRSMWHLRLPITIP